MLNLRALAESGTCPLELAARAVAAAPSDSHSGEGEDFFECRRSAFADAAHFGDALLQDARRGPASSLSPSARRRPPPLTPLFKFGRKQLDAARDLITSQLRDMSNVVQLSNVRYDDLLYIHQGLQEAQQAEAAGEETKCKLLNSCQGHGLKVSSKMKRKQANWIIS